MFFFSKKNIKFIWIAVFIFVPVLMIFTQDWIVSFLERGHGTENLTSMGGRLDVWSSLINFNNMTYEIIYGYGYQMLFSSGISSEQAEYGITMAHNNFIQSFLGLGLLGFIPFCIFWIRNIYWTSKQFFISNRSPKSVFLFITSISIFVYSSVEFGIAGPSNIITPVFFIILFAANKKYKSIL
jgi:O-antigen ligase